LLIAVLLLIYTFSIFVDKPIRLMCNNDDIWPARA